MVKSVFLITGDNGPEKEEFLQALKAQVLKPPVGPDAFTVLFASETADGDLLNAAAGASLFSSVKLTLVRELESLKSPALKILADAVENPAPAAVLALEGKRLPKMGKGHPFLKALEEEHPWVEVKSFEAPPPYKMEPWITETARRRFKRGLDSAGARLLQEFAGDEPEALVMEMEKLDLVLPAGKSILPDDIRRYTAQGRSRRPWDLPHPVGLKDTAEALRVLKNLLDFFHPPVQILYFLSDHFMRLARLKAYFVENPEASLQVERLLPQGFRAREELNAALARAANESGFAKKSVAPGAIYAQIILPRVMDQLKNYKLDDLKYALRLLATAEFNLKTGRLRGDFQGLSSLVLQLVHADLHRVETVI